MFYLLNPPDQEEMFAESGKMSSVNSTIPLLRPINLYGRPRVSPRTPSSKVCISPSSVESETISVETTDFWT